MILHSSLLWSRQGLSDETCWRFPRSLYAVYKTKSVYFFFGRLLFHHSFPCFVLRCFCKFSLRLLFYVDSFLISYDGNTLVDVKKSSYTFISTHSSVIVLSSLCMLKQFGAVKYCSLGTHSPSKYFQIQDQ